MKPFGILKSIIDRTGGKKDEKSGKYGEQALC